MKMALYEKLHLTFHEKKLRTTMVGMKEDLVLRGMSHVPVIVGPVTKGLSCTIAHKTPYDLINDCRSVKKMRVLLYFDNSVALFRQEDGVGCIPLATEGGEVRAEPQDVFTIVED